MICLSSTFPVFELETVLQHEQNCGVKATRFIFLHKTQRNYPENTHVCIKSCFLILEADATNGVTELRGLPCWRWEGGVEAFRELSVPLPRAVCMGDNRTYWGGCQTEDSPGRFHRPLRSWGVSSYSSPLRWPRQQGPANSMRSGLLS